MFKYWAFLIPYLMKRREFIRNVMLSLGLIPFATDSFAGYNTYQTLEQKIIPRKGVWTVRRDWTKEEMTRYGAWFANIYDRKRNGSWKQKGAKFPAITADPEMNLLHDERLYPDTDLGAVSKSCISKLHAANACGTFPFVMHLYYSAVRGLPAVYSSVEGNGGDIRYSRGNHPVRHYDCLSFGGDLGEFINAVFFSGRGGNNFTTGNWRTQAELEGTDTVPIEVDPKTLVPGLSLGYNPHGHGLVIAKVMPDGQIGMLDSHPDNSITCGQNWPALNPVSESVGENKASWVCGVKSIRLAILDLDASGRIIRCRPRRNSEVFGYSLSQYHDLVSIRRSEPIEIRGKKIKVTSFPMYCQEKLRVSDEMDPYATLVSWAGSLHTMFQERARFVDEAWADVRASGPITLPNNANIYQAEGRWERWSSPSSDCDRKSMYKYGVDSLARIVEAYGTDRAKVKIDPALGKVTTQTELVMAIVGLKTKMFAEKRIEYTSSRGKKIALTLSDIEKRLFDLSFDPNHAPEVRWGATDGELGDPVRYTTPLSAGGGMPYPESYSREKNLRNRMERKYGVTSLDALESRPDILLESVLSRYVKK